MFPSRPAAPTNTRQMESPRWLCWITTVAMASAHLATAMQHPNFRGSGSHYYAAALVVVTVAVATSLVFSGRHEKTSEVGRTITVTPKFVMDGNSFYGATPEGKLVLLRLRLIDAPLLDQPRGREARLHLRKLLLMSPPSEVLCSVTGVDEMGGLISDVFTHRIASSSSFSSVLATESENVQENMVRHGWAWAMDSGFAPNEQLRAAMAEARVARRGLWQDDDPIAPREYRRATQRGFYLQSRSAAVRHRTLARHTRRHHRRYTCSQSS